MKWLTLMCTQANTNAHIHPTHPHTRVQEAELPVTSSLHLHALCSLMRRSTWPTRLTAEYSRRTASGRGKRTFCFSRSHRISVTPTLWWTLLAPRGVCATRRVQVWTIARLFAADGATTPWRWCGPRGATVNSTGAATWSARCAPTTSGSRCASNRHWLLPTYIKKKLSYLKNYGQTFDRYCPSKDFI